MSDANRWRATVHVGGLAAAVTAATLHDAFLPFGEIADVALPRNDNPQTREAEPHRGFAYVEFEDAEDAREAADNMDQAELFGRAIRVSAAKPPKSSAAAEEGMLGSRVAVWQQEGWLAKHEVGEGDKMDAEPTESERPEDPMQTLEGLDVAGPKPQ